MPQTPDTHLSRIGLRRQWVETLAAYGIVTLAQLLDRLEKQPRRLEGVLATSSGELRQALSKALGPKALAMQARRPVVFAMPPLIGLAGPAMHSPRIAEVRRFTMAERKRLRDELALLAQRKSALPTRIDLTGWLPGVRNQGSLGSCTGFGATTTREFTSLTSLSPGWAYRGAKSLDGAPDIEGSWQYFAMEFFREIGHIEEGVYTYQDAIDGRPLEPLHGQAARWRIANFADLLPDPDDFSTVPLILRAALAGRLAEGLGPQPVSVSLALFESMDSYTTHATGLVTVPLPGETMTGGHAMSVVGYLDATDPRGLYGINYFIVRNSWGAEWAADNPHGLPGHALVPEGYFQSPERVHELLLSLAEPSPALQRTVLGRLMRAMRAAVG